MKLRNGALALAKALRGAEVPGHKYQSRTPKAGGGFRYVYHGTDVTAAQGIREHGFVAAAHTGISSTTNPVFVYVALYREAAKWYSANNFRIAKNEGTVVRAGLTGRILDTGKDDDYKAAQAVAVQLGVQPESQSIFDWTQVADALRANGYVGFSFKDRSGSGRLSYAVIPSALKVK